MSVYRKLYMFLYERNLWLKPSVSVTLKYVGQRRRRSTNIRPAVSVLYMYIFMQILWNLTIVYCQRLILLGLFLRQ